MIKGTGKILEFETMSFEQVMKMLNPAKENSPINITKMIALTKVQFGG